MGNTIDTYIPMYIAQTVESSPRDVVTAERWNELWNLSIMQGDYTALIVDLLCEAAVTNSTELASHDHDSKYYTKAEITAFLQPLQNAPLPNAVDVDITDVHQVFTQTTVEGALYEVYLKAMDVPSAAEIDIADSAGHFTGTNVEAALAELFTYAGNGKELIADAITGQGVDADASDTFQELADKIAEIEGGGTGEPPVPGDPNFPTDADLIPSNILQGVDIFGVVGTHVCVPPDRYFGLLEFTYTPYAI